MVVCKFFAQGNCRYGNNCKFDHVSNSNQYNSSNQGQNQYQSRNFNSNYNNNNQQNNSNNNYRYNANNINNYSSPQAANPFSKIVSNKVVNTPKIVDPDNISTNQDFLDFISEDFKLWFNSSAWKLSSYKYNKNAMNLPILQDVSNEEVRFALWEAKKNNRYNEELQQFQIKYNQVIQTIKEIYNPNQPTREYLLNYFHESLKKQNLNSTPQKVNPFVQIIQKKQQDLQSQSQSQAQANLFSQLTNSQPVQGFMQSQQLNQIQTSGSFLFTQSPKPANPFTELATNRQQSNAVDFSNQVTQGFQNQTNQTLFNSNKPTSQPPEPQPDINPDPRIYSNTSDLNQQDLGEFKASHFTLGLIPHCPPSKMLCL